MRSRFALSFAEFLAFGIVGSAFSSHATADTPIVPSTTGSLIEIALPSFQTESLTQDMPVQALYLDSTGSLWMLGQQKLWQWQTTTRKLRRIALTETSTNQTEKPSSLTGSGANIFVTTDQSVYQYNPTRADAFHYEHPLTNTGKSLGFIGENNAFWWMHQNALFHIDTQAHSITPQTNHLGQNLKAQFDAHTRRWLVIKDKEIISLPEQENPSPGQLTARIIFRAKHPILDLQQDGDHYMAHTARSVLRLNPAGRVVQAIPVEGKHKLRRMLIHPQKHIYLFDDHLLEIFDLLNKSSTRYDLPIAPQTVIQQLQFADDKIAVLSDDGIRLFQLAP